jgi:23S rRNA (cytidine1920-2'-O)/16S rRNA (cytidine1409-2'-O)-methyltransferase
MAAKERVDILLAEQGLVESRSAAQKLIMAGLVRANGERVQRPAQRLTRSVTLTLDAQPPYVSRGGEKLAAGLQAFGIDVEGRVCADIGASTGGFTDCLLQRGAVRVYAVDVGHGILHWRLRNDERVVVLEGVNARHLEQLPERTAIVTLDLAFISLRLILPRIPGWIEPGGQIVALVKPQFEAGKQAVGRGGVVRDPAVHAQVLAEVTAAAAEVDLQPQGIMASPLRGPKGNVEYLMWARDGGPRHEWGPMIRGAVSGVEAVDEAASGILPAAGGSSPAH